MKKLEILKNFENQVFKNLHIFGQCLTCCYSTSIRVKRLVLCQTLCYTLKNTHVKNWNPISLTTIVIKKMR